MFTILISSPFPTSLFIDFFIFLPILSFLIPHTFVDPFLSFHFFLSIFTPFTFLTQFSYFPPVLVFIQVLFVFYVPIQKSLI